MKRVLALTIAGLLFVVAPPVSAQNTQCDRVIVDDANVLSGNMQAISSVVEKLENLGADVRVRTVRSFGRAGTLDRYEQQMWQRCTSWQDASGRNRKNNLLVMMMSLDERKAGIYFGEQWSGALNGQWPRIASSFMAPKFRDGDFAGGFAAALSESHRLMDAYLHPPVATQPQPRPAPVVVQQAPREPMDLTGLWRVLWGVLLLGAIVGIFFLVRAYLRERERRRVAQQRALVRRQAVASLVNQFADPVGDVVMVGVKAKELARQVGKADADELLGSVEKMRAQVAEVTEAFANADQSAGDPNKGGLSVSEYEEMETSYTAILERANAAKSSMGEVEHAMDELQMRIQQFPDRLAALRNDYERANAAVEKAASEGYRVELVAAMLRNVRDAIPAIEKLYEDRELSEAYKLLHQYTDMAIEAGLTANSYAQQRAALEERCDALEERLGALAGELETGRSEFATMSEVFAVSSWEVVSGNGSEAEQCAQFAADTLVLARDAASMEKQRWSDADESLNEAWESVHQTESLLNAISSLHTELKQARDIAPQEIDDAEADIAKAWAYIGEHDPDIPESREDDLRDAEDSLDDAQDEMAREKPNYLVVVKAARAANQAADEILAMALSDVEEADRLRRRIEATRADLQRSITAAKNYIRTHRIDVENRAEVLLKVACDARYDIDPLYARLSAQEEFDADAHRDILKRYQDADANADGALEEARQDVASAEAERRRQREEDRRRATAAAAKLRLQQQQSFRSSTSTFNFGGGGGGSIGFGGGGGGGGSVGW